MTTQLGYDELPYFEHELKIDQQSFQKGDGMSIHKNILFSAFILITAFSAAAQTYTDDSLIVREILDMNGLDTVDVDAVTSKISDRLYGLYLDRTGISILPESLGELDSLQNLQIQDNKLTALPQSIGNCTRLRYLSAYDNQIHELPESIANCSELELLYLIRNRFTKFPTALLGLKKLLTIDFGGNHLTEVPPEIAAYEQPVRIYINDNYLTTLPETFTTMEPELIHVAGNLLCNLSEAMGQWLDTYDFYNTRNTNQTWRQYQGCDRLELEESVVQKVLDENGLGYLDMTAITETDDLGVTTLDLSYENIMPQGGLSKKQANAPTLLVLPSDIDSLKSLKTLSLSGNQLSEPPAELHRLYHITSLDLSGNNLTELPDYLLSFENLDHLDVSGNALTSLSEDLDAWVSSLDPDWKETQQTTRNGTTASLSKEAPTSISMNTLNGSKPVFNLNVSQPARGYFTLYSLDGKKLFSTGMRKFNNGNTAIRIDESVLAAGTCYGILETDYGRSAVTFALTR